MKEYAEVRKRLLKKLEEYGLTLEEYLGAK